MSTNTKSTDKLEVYLDGEGKWRWRRTSRNGRINAASEQSFKGKYYALKMAVLNNKDIAKHRVVERFPTGNRVMKSKLIERYL